MSRVASSPLAYQASCHCAALESVMMNISSSAISGERSERTINLGRSAKHAQLYCDRYRLAVTWLPQGKKEPMHEGWNRAGGYITDPEQAMWHWTQHPTDGIGVVLGSSDLCSLDADHLEHTRTVLDEFGIDLNQLIAQYPTVVGNPERRRIMFRVPPGVDLSRRKLVWP